MKINHTILNILISIILISIGTLIGASFNAIPPAFPIKTETISPEVTAIKSSIRPKVQEDSHFIMSDEMGANPESTITSRETYLEKPYRIDESSGLNEVQVYFPAFFQQSLNQQNEFSQKIQKIGSYKLIIQIFRYEPLNEKSIQDFYGLIGYDFSSITFRFYDIPENYQLLFQSFHLPLVKKDLHVEFYGKMFPDGFMIDSIIFHINEMLRKVLQPTEKLRTIVLNFEEAGNLYFLLTSEGAQYLQQLPVQSLYTKRILINILADVPGNTLHGKDKLSYFFRESSIKNMYIEGIGKKEGTKISLDGF